MKVVVTGGSGFIGGHLVRALAADHHEVVVISRSARAPRLPGVRAATWEELEAQSELIDGSGAIVNLAGESINQRWTRTAKEAILQSRLTAAAAVARAVERAAVKPAVVVNGSGMSIYGSSETAVFDEMSPSRLTDFLGEVVEQWEAAADQIRADRLVKLRTGIVLAADGGALPKMLLPYKLGVGGPVGSGRQWLSWIHIRDMVEAILFCIRRESISGAVNCTAPQPVRNAEFGREIGRAFHRPHWLPVPSLALRIMFGEMAVLLLEGQKVLPKKLEDAGFRFHFQDISSALADIAKGGGPI